MLVQQSTPFPVVVFGIFILVGCILGLSLAGAEFFNPRMAEISSAATATFLGLNYSSTESVAAVTQAAQYPTQTYQAVVAQMTQAPLQQQLVSQLATSTAAVKQIEIVSTQQAMHVNATQASLQAEVNKAHWEIAASQTQVAMSETQFAEGIQSNRRQEILMAGIAIVAVVCIAAIMFLLCLRTVINARRDEYEAVAKAVKEQRRLVELNASIRIKQSSQKVAEKMKPTESVSPQLTSNFSPQKRGNHRDLPLAGD